jgi:hypothetical protein
MPKGIFPRKPMTKEWKKRISDSMKLVTRTEEHKKNISLSKLGSNNPMWLGGRTSWKITLRGSGRYKQWRKAVFERDGYQCVVGGKEHGIKLQVDHIYPLCSILDDFNINSMEDAIQCEGLWDINNGRTLCRECHKKTETYAINQRFLPENLRSQRGNLLVPEIC